MSSLVSDFLVNPVLRQARRFSEISRSTLVGDEDHAVEPPPPEAVTEAGHVEEAAPEPIAAPVQTSPRPRPLSSSTEETTVEEVLSSPEVAADEPRDHLGFPLSPRKSRAVLEDDGMHRLRSRIHAINAQAIPATEKARLMHEVMLEGYRSAQAASHGRASHDNPEPLGGPTREHTTPAGPLDSLKFWHGQFGDHQGADKFFLTESDVAPSYAPIRQSKSSGTATPTESQSPDEQCPPLGCQHYERNVKMQCSTCSKWYTCRFCHDSHEDHNLIRKDTKNMLCMLCGTPQRASDTCINCGEVAAHYYCNVCKLWENRKNKPIYHCNDCGICRRGLGLGKDFFHCKTCRACITTSIESSHKCIERSTECDCPICGEYMFTSPKPVVFMNCGHSIHKKCYDQHMRVSYKCPICNKSLANMETQFRNLEAAIQSQPMPAEFRDTKATVLCNDCSGKSTVPYHWLGLKCSICRSYNTVEIQIHGEDSREAPAASGSSAAGVPAPSQPREDSARPTAISAGSRVGTWAPNRRRHSSHGVELQHPVPDRIARSLSPHPLGIDSHLPPLAADVDSDDDIFGFWRGNQADDGSSDEDESDSDQDDSDGPLSVDGEDDDDDEDEIILIGHR